MTLLKQNLLLPKPALLLLASIIVSLHAMAQRPLPDAQPSRGSDSNGRSNADVQVWVGVDVLPGGWSGQGSASDFPVLPAQGSNAEFAGAWTAETLPGVVLTLQLDGDFSFATPVNPERLCSAGVERGTWFVSADTNELLFHIQTDTNGHCGLSDLDATIAIVETDGSLTMVIDDSAAGAREIPLVQTDP